RTTHLRAHDRDSIFRIDEAGGAATNLERALAEIARLGDPLLVDYTDTDVDGMFLETLKPAELLHRNELPVDQKGVESIALRPTRDIGVKPLARLYQRRQHLEWTTAGGRLHLFYDCSQSLFFDRQIAIRTELRAGFGKEQPQEMINFRHRRDGCFPAPACDTLLDRDARRQPFDQIDVRFFQLLD